MKLYPLRPIEIVLLLVFIAFADLFTYIQAYFLPADIRPFTYLLFVVVVLLVYFLFVRPKDWSALAGTLALVVGIIAIILVVIQDALISYHLSWRTLVVILGAVIGPYVAGWLYGAIAGPR
ncbi:MAG TPA: hypothetical protein VMB35_10140 [Methanomicrobiales archaeon]|nr:hypothetical protein [Methanomicrobiales archaeon]